MPRLYQVHYYHPSDASSELQKHVIAADEADVRGFLTGQEGSEVAPGWTIFDMGEVEGAPGVFGPTQLTRGPDGRWDETA